MKDRRDLLILQSIVNLSTDEQKDIIRRDAQQDFVTGVVERFIFVLIDLEWKRCVSGWREWKECGIGAESSILVLR